MSMESNVLKEIQWRLLQETDVDVVEISKNRFVFLCRGRLFVDGVSTLGRLKSELLTADNCGNIIYAQ